MINSMFDLSVERNYLTNKMFLDPSGPVTLQRYDEAKYQKIRDYSLQQWGNFWTPEEINLQKDKTDMESASPAVIHIFTSNLLRQTALDGEQSRFPVNVFGPCISIPELEELFFYWSVFEVLHSRSYSYIIRTIYNSSSEEFRKIYDIEPIVKMSANIGKYYDELYRINCMKATSNQIMISDWQHKKAILLALHTSYALEAVRFITSFATSLAMKEQGIFMGNGSEIELIMRDELLHMDWSAYLLNILPYDDTDYFDLQNDSSIRDEIEFIYNDVKREEKEWGEYLFQQGSVIGLNHNILNDNVDWNFVKNINKLTGVDTENLRRTATGPRSNPLPWMERYMGHGTLQKAPQETELTNYVIGSLGKSTTKELDEIIL